ncbi:MAG: hypothetical protein JKY09_02195, partial [Crocinitomicaceae bacterium]|nr:hypothetical protein [Crocinitomicaceae bacterium]
LIGEKPSIFKADNADPTLYKKLWSTITSGKTWIGEFNNKKKDGTPFLVRTAIAPVLDENGETMNYLSVMENTTKQKEVEMKLHDTLENMESLVSKRTSQLEIARKNLEISLDKEKKLSELKSRFVATASHQFRTPLTVINANVGLLKMYGLDEESQGKLDKISNRIQSEVRRMTELMDETLILGKINSGGIRVNLQMCGLIVLAEKIVEKFNAIQDDGRKMEIKVVGDAREIKLDVKLMEHALSNLVSNAFKYSPNCTPPMLTINFEEKGIKITVKDHGVGIPKKDLKNVFTAFYRGSNVNDIKGTGMGTSIAKEYVELNGGTIGVTSEENRGASFTIELKDHSFSEEMCGKEQPAEVELSLDHST